MSSQGWAAGFQGLAQGLKSGLDMAQERQKLAMEQAIKERMLGMQEQELGLKKESAARDAENARIARAISGITGVDEQNNIQLAPGFGELGQNYWDATSARKLKDSGKIGLEAIADPKISGKFKPGTKAYFDPEALIKPEGGDWIEKLIAADQLRANADARKYQRDRADQLYDKDKEVKIAQAKEAQRQAEEFSKRADKLAYDEIIGSYENLKKELGGFNENIDTNLFPSNFATGAEAIIGPTATIIANSAPEFLGGRNPKQELVAAYLQKIANPEARKNIGAAQTAGESLREAIAKGRLGGGKELARILSEDYDKVLRGLNDLKATYQQGTETLADRGGMSRFSPATNKPSPMDAVANLPPPTGKEPAGTLVMLPNGSKAVSRGNGNYTEVK